MFSAKSFKTPFKQTNAIKPSSILMKSPFGKETTLFSNAPLFAQNQKFDMSTRLFVGNLSWSTSEDELRDLFQSHGAVASVKVVTDRETGRAKGFGFVEFEDDKAAMNAMNTLNGKEFLGRDLRVSKANPPRPREVF